MNYFDTYALAHTVNNAVEAMLNECEAELVSTSRIGLDDRAGAVYVTRNAIIRKGATNSLEYYGGFEYVDKMFVTEAGNYTVYSDEDERVRDCLDRFFEIEREEEEY